MLSTQRICSGIVLGFIVGAAVIAYYATSVSTTTSVVYAQSEESIAGPPPSIAWAALPWTGDDRPYQQIRATIDAETKTGQQGDNSIQHQYQEAMQQDPTNPQKAFAWSYYQVKTTSHWTIFYDFLLDKMYAPLLKARNPQTYNYTRLLFLTIINPHLTALGERLLSHDPQDDAVKGRLDSDYIALINTDAVNKHHYDLGAENRAIALAQQILKANPKDALTWGGLGDIYLSAYYYNGKHPTDAHHVAQTMQQFVRFAPPSWDASVAKRIIQEMQAASGK